MHVYIAWNHVSSSRRYFQTTLCRHIWYYSSNEFPDPDIWIDKWILYCIVLAYSFESEYDGYNFMILSTSITYHTTFLLWISYWAQTETNRAIAVFLLFGLYDHYINININALLPPNYKLACRLFCWEMVLNARFEFTKRTVCFFYCQKLLTTLYRCDYLRSKKRFKHKCFRDSILHDDWCSW